MIRLKDRRKSTEDIVQYRHLIVLIRSLNISFCWIFFIIIIVPYM